MIRKLLLPFLFLAPFASFADDFDDFYDATGYYDTFGSSAAPVSLEAYGDSPTAYYNSDGSVYYRKTIDGIEWQYMVSDGKVSLGGGYGISYGTPWYRRAIFTYSPETIATIAIPATIDDCPVVGINGYAFGNCEYLVEILIPDGVRSIGEHAFSGGSSRFSGCSRLASLTVPKSVTNIGEGAFEDCFGLRTLYLPWSYSGTPEVPSGCTIVRYDKMVSFSVSSPVGAPVPACGTSIAPSNEVLSCSVSSPVEELGWRYDCTGWRGTGSVPASGTSNRVDVLMLEDSSIEWSWETNVWIDVAVASGGSTSFQPQWVAEGEAVSVVLSPNWSLYDLALSGDTNGVTRSGSTLYVPADAPRTIRATFTERKLSLAVSTPMGEASPGPGTHLYSHGDHVTATAVSPLREENGEQVVCSGWTGTGSVPASGTGNTVDVLMLEDSSIAWLWDTNVWIECAVSGDAVPSGPGSGWFRKDGESAVFAFAPAVRPFLYVLFGDADGVLVDSSAGTIAIPADRPRTVELHVLTRGEAGESGTGKPLPWSDGADAPWFAVADNSRADGFCLQSGEVAQGGTSALETTVVGPGRISFAWKITANRTDYARFYVDGANQTNITRSTDWVAVGPLELGAGEHVLRWAFERGSAAGGAAFLDDVCWQSRHALTVSSTDGTPTPAAGTNDVYWGEEIAASVEPPAPTAGGKTRRVCAGWTGTGGIPTSGTGTNVTFTVEGDSSLTWNWRTEHWIDVAVESGGTTAFRPQWTAEGTILSVALSPDWTLYDLALSGDTEGVTRSGSTLSVPADGPRTIRATITERKISLAVSSAFGAAYPTAGTHVHSWGDSVAASVAAPPEEDGTRHLCTGWTGTGSVPACGSDSSVSFTMQEDSTLAWNWRTEHWLSLETKGPVESDFKAGWRAAGTMLDVAFEVFWEGDCGVTLGGDTNGVVLDAAARTLAVPCDGPRDIVLTAQPTGLAAALDAPELVWTSEGSNAWTPQTVTTADGEDAATSGPAGTAGGGDSVLSTALVGPGTLSWSWRLDSVGGSGIDLVVDGDTPLYIESDRAGSWVEESVSISGEGRHEVQFVFWNESGSAEDRGFVDCVSWTGAAAVPGATATTPAPVPLDWLVSHGLAAEGATDAEFEAAALATAENGRPVWECYVAGLDPTKKDDFRVFIDMDGGEPVVTWWPSNVAGRAYAVWGKADLADEWSCPVEPSHRFYQVRVALGGASGVDERAWPGSVVVTFDAAGGAVDPATRTYDAPGALGRLPVPVRDGYDFSGWRTGTAGGIEATADTAIPWCDWTLVATWRDPLARALNPALVFAKGGSAEWFAQNDDTHDGESAARSGAIADGQDTWFETTVAGPGTVGFWWKVSGESPDDCLRFYVDGLQRAGIGGTGNSWAQETFAVSGAGDHVLRWSYDKDGGDSSVSGCGWVDEVVWTPDVFTLRFDANGGSAVEPIMALYGSALIAPSAPTRDGYTFAGWLPAFPPTMPLGGATLTAQWTPRNYTISFDSAGGSAVASITAPYGSALTEPSAPTLDGYTFAGWSPAFPPTMPLGGTTLTAQWTPRNYTISFDSAGGSAVASITAPCGSALTAPSTPTLDGYTFAGWSPAFPPTMPPGGATLTAQWTPRSYTISFDSADGSAVSSITAPYGSALTAPAAPTRDGYMFAGWSPAFPATMPLGGATLVASWTPEGVLTWTVSDGTVTITGTQQKPVGDFVIPAEIDGLPVTSIGNYAFEHCSGLTSVTIPDSVKSIGNYAFEYCSGLTAITIPDSVTSIGNYAFSDCSGLTSITIGNGVTSIGNGAFEYCSGLTSVTIPDGVKSVGGSAFSYCSKLTSVTISDSVTSIGNAAFRGCSGLVEMTLPFVGSQRGNSGSEEACFDYIFGTSSYDQVPSSLRRVVITDETRIGNYAFEHCSGLTSVTIPDGVTSIGYYAFSDCSGLNSLTIPDSVTSIGSYAFFGCSGLTSITIGNGVTNIGSSAFYSCSGLTSFSVSSDNPAFSSGNGCLLSKDGTTLILGINGNVTIPDSVTSIGDEAFYSCSGLTSIAIPDSVTNIGDEAFCGCSGLTSITIPDSVTRIGGWAFEGCRGLSSVTIPDSVTSIENGVFYNCSGLTSITIPDSVTGIGDSAFSGCSGLTSITVPDSVTSIGEYVFYGCSGLVEMTLPFVGSQRGNSGRKEALFGYIFGTVNYSGGTSIYQYYTNSSYCTYYIPSSLRRVIITDETILGYGAFDDCSMLTSVTISDSVTSIGGRAFFGCSGLTSITIGNGVTSIGDHAFVYCSGLTSITIPDSVTSIGNYAFADCSALASITIGNGVTSIGNYAFEDCSALTSITIGNGVTSIGDHAFHRCSGLTSFFVNESNSTFSARNGLLLSNDGRTLFFGVNSAVTIPDSVTSIGNYAFEYCSALTSITIPDSVTRIGDRAFVGCSGLTSITIGNGVTSIGSYAFASCSGLTSITIPDSVTSIGSYAFNGCSGLTSVTADPKWVSLFSSVRNLSFTIPDNVTSIGNNAFSGCSGLASITIPDSVTSIGYDAFSGCSGLTSVTADPKWGCQFSSMTNLSFTITDGVTSIGNSAFSYCRGLTAITIPDSVTSIGNYAFYNCSGLTSVTIPDSVTSIGDSAFSGCSGLTSITIPDGVTSIGYAAFSSCSGLMSVTIPDGLTSIPGSAFSGCSRLMSITIPDSVTSIEDWAFYGCSGLTSVNISDLSAWCGIDFSGSYVNPCYYAHHLFLNGTEITDLTIPDGLTSIGDQAFNGCSGLTSVTIPDSVTNIGSYAFNGCSGLTSVTIPDSVTNIGSYAFNGCSGLTSVTIPDSVTGIGSNSFEGCFGLTSITIPDSMTSIVKSVFSGCSGLTSVTIPDSVTNIGQTAFYNCSGLASITIPNSVTSIGSDAFGGCSGLMSVTADPKWRTCFYSAMNLSFTIPDGVTSIGEYAFRDWSRLTSITIPDSVTSIGGDAFSGCSGLMTITIPDSVKSIGPRAFSGCNYLFDTHTIPGTRLVDGWAVESDRTLSGTLNLTGIRGIGSYAFSGCSGLTSVTIPDGVTSIGDHAFEGCSRLTSVTIPDSVTRIELGSFHNCSGLTSVTIPDGVTSIGDESFSSCSGLTAITIPDGVTSIGSYAFSNCSGLTSVTIPDSVTRIGYHAFSDCSGLRSLSLPGRFRGNTSNMSIPSGCTVTFRD